MFKKERCDLCGDCLAKCQWIDCETDQAVNWMTAMMEKEHTPEKEHFIDELFALCGVTRVERVFDRENAKCCASVKLMLNIGDPTPDVKENVLDAKNAGADAMVCLCPMCMHSLDNVATQNHLPQIFLGDIARMALGEIHSPAIT